MRTKKAAIAISHYTKLAWEIFRINGFGVGAPV